ncbi:LOW QUALITY PROTEIN: acid sphingomyelinase-like phosphodiesterase 3a [Betta splendens]|uniref:Acid sphingomyelinase-like phosphodiesterase n=1 Tax=Betta splendens TaxID=158456 RepID=A0A6P7LU33_BETSP|nr:LOW QUALITY PROTEIN: acid sphingomyelinase-like phosphodiesterase 3a [Betta splendens]
MLELHTFVLLCCSAAPLWAAPTRSHLPPGTARFWHITDLHLDPSYHLGPDPTTVCLSSKGAAASGAGVFGDFLCDSPFSLIRSAFTSMAALTQPQDFIIWTGDSPPHVPVDKLSTDAVVQVIANMTHTLRQHFPQLTVYPALGNHDYWPQDQMPDSTNAVYEAAAELWKPWLQPEALSTLSRGGFYSQLARPGLRILSLNTILYYGPNRATRNATDPAGQFKWLEATLQDAARNQEKVYIIAHVPVGFLPFASGTTAMRAGANERLVSVFRRYSHVIAGQFYGHTHRDSVMVLLDRRGEAVSSAFVAPAVTPIRNVLEAYSNNPAFRTYWYHTGDYSLRDVWQYFLNLTEANQKQRSDWRLEYVMSEAFGLTDLQPRSLLQLGLSLLPAPSRTFPTYFSHYMVDYDRSITCEGECQLRQVCAVLHMDRPSYSKCVSERRAGFSQL